MATNLPSCFSIQFLEQLLKFLVNFTSLKYVKSQRSYGFLITKELIFGFQILDLKDHFSASLNTNNGATRYTQIKVGRNKSYFTSDPLNSDNKYTANDICKMIEFLVDNIYMLGLVNSFSDKWLAFL